MRELLFGFEANHVKKDKFVVLEHRSLLQIPIFALVCYSSLYHDITQSAFLLHQEFVLCKLIHGTKQQSLNW